MNKKRIIMLLLVTVLLLALTVSVYALPLCPVCGYGCDKVITCLENGYDQVQILCPHCGYVWSTTTVPCTHILPQI